MRPSAPAIVVSPTTSPRPIMAARMSIRTRNSSAGRIIRVSLITGPSMMAATNSQPESYASDDRNS
jgi:hypothetical protein